jgi:hypothetical protein
MTDKLSIYNLTLRHLEERKLASLSEPREPRRVLDDFYDQEVAWCLERHLWKFAQRSVQIDASETIVPFFGFNFSFDKPPDYVRMILLSTTPTFKTPYIGYKEEGGQFYGDFTPIYLMYVSNDVLYGMNLGVWPATFVDFVTLHIAVKACKRITGSTEMLKVLAPLYKEARRVSAANDAMEEGPEFPPQSTWVRARRGFQTGMPQAGDNPGGSLLG